MDLTTILPLLLGGKNPDMAKILTAMNGQKSSSGGTSDIISAIVANQNKGSGTSDEKKPPKSDDRASLLSGLMGGGSQAEMLASILGTMNKPKTPKAGGLSVIQKIAPNDILGVMLKHYSK